MGDNDEQGFVLGVLGTSGGVGASALATACAVRAAQAGRAGVLVDGHPWSGGIEVMAGLEATAGLRWGDVGGVRGDVDSERLVRELPRAPSGFRCLSWAGGPSHDGVPDPGPVLAAVRAAVPVVVVDLPRPARGGSHETWWAACDDIVLVVDGGVAGVGPSVVVADVLRGVSGLAPRGASGVVLRGPQQVRQQDVERALRAPLLTRLSEDRSLRRCLERGNAVGGEPGALADAADEVLAALLPSLRAA